MHQLFFVIHFGKHVCCFLVVSQGSRAQVWVRVGRRLDDPMSTRIARKRALTCTVTQRGLPNQLQNLRVHSAVVEFQQSSPLKPSDLIHHQQRAIGRFMCFVGGAVFGLPGVCDGEECWRFVERGVLRVRVCICVGMQTFKE